MIRGRHYGSSLVELAVVTGIVGGLLVMLAPALNRATNAARQTTCVSNLKQLTQGMLQYEIARGYLPPAGLMQTRPPCSGQNGFDCFPINQREGPMASWIVLTLPYIGEQALYDKFDLSRSVCQQTHNAASTLVPSLICPSFSSASAQFYDGRGNASCAQTNSPPARGNYAAFATPNHVEHQEFLPGAVGGFTPGDTHGQPMSAILDGLGNTLAISEVRWGLRPWDHRGVWSLPYPAASLIGGDVHHSGPFRPPVACYDPVMQEANTPNQSTVVGLGDSLFVCREANTMFQLGMPCIRISGQLMINAPRSFHVGGVNATRLDGSCTFLTDDIDVFVYGRSIHTRDSNCGGRRHQPPLPNTNGNPKGYDHHDP